MKNSAATSALIACSLFLAMTVGTSFYEHMFGIPQMLKSPAALNNTFANDLGQAQTYWIPLHALIFSSLVLSLIFNWKNSTRKRWLVYSFISYLYISIISIYFAKELFSFQDLPDNLEFYQRTNQWIMLSWHRPVLMLILELFLLIALSKPTLQLTHQRFNIK